MRAWKTTLLLSCLATQTSHAQPALDPAFIDYLMVFGDEPELFDAASDHVQPQQTQPNTQTMSTTIKQTSTHTQEIKK